MRPRGGFTLLEVLVATTILAIAIGALMSNLSVSMRTAGRLTEADRAALLARRKMDELLAAAVVPRFVPMEGAWGPETGLDGGWRARRMPFEVPPQAGPGTLALDRLELEVWWKAGTGRRTFTIEGYRSALMLDQGGVR